MKKLLIVAVVLGVLLYFFGEKKWLGGGTTHLEWTEDVSLASGEKIQIERDVKFRWGFIFLGGREGNETLRSVVRPAAGSKAFPEWSAPMLPILLDRDPVTGTWWLVATTEEEKFWQRNQEPQPPYWGFKTQVGRWVRTSVPDQAWGRVANLFVRYDYDDSTRTLRHSLKVRKANQKPLFEGDFTSVVDKSFQCRCMPSELPRLSKVELDLTGFAAR